MAETYALSLGNDLPIRITVTSEHGETVTGLSPTFYFAAVKGGTAIADPDASGDLDEDTGSSATARVYEGTVDAAIVDGLVALGHAALWLAIEITGDLLVWRRVRVVKHRVIE